jgi:hypothetical protein
MSRPDSRRQQWNSAAPAVFLAAAAALLQACGGGGEDSGSSGDAATLENTKPFVADGPYSAVLKSCITATSTEDSCTLTDLPLLGMMLPAPDSDSIMQRVVVSHNWMGQNFELALDDLPTEIIQLMSGVTAIVIDDDTRPAYYSGLTGAIYLDSAYLWLTNEEKPTVTTREDYRSHFADELAFRSLWRYVKDDDYAYPYYPLDGSEEREISDLRYPPAKLLLHELAHANDFFPPAAIGSLNPNLTLVEASQALSDDRISEQLTAWSPLTSETMLALARVMFRGEPASDAQKALSAAEVGGEFEADVANDDYAHNTIREDLAMLFEEVMMKYLFGIDRDIAYTPNPTDASGCSAYIVEWGNRNRIGDPEVKARAQFVVSALLPEVDFDLFFQDLALPTPMQNGVDWCSNLQLGAPQQLLQVFSADRIRSLDERVHGDVGPPREE